jgi:lipid-A-disaccharide synthase
VHYVSPSIWAWRENRARKIGESADRVLCLFPMEPAIYEKYGVDARFVGHPLADRFALGPDRDAARKEIGLAAEAPVLSLLPGSRLSEIRRLGRTFLDAAQRVAAAIPGLQIVIPAANEGCRRELETILNSAGTSARSQGSRTPNPVLLDGQAHRAMVAADVVLLASGTAALEAMLAKRPMVVGYRIAPFTHAVVKGLGMLKTNVYSLPNVLAGRALVPELMQGDCTPERLADAVLGLFRDTGRRDELMHEFERMHLSLHTGGGAAASAARAIGQLLIPHATEPKQP